MKVLFIGGTGKISSACTPLAAQRGFDMYLLNRGQTDRPVPEGVTVLHGDIRDKASAAAAIAGHTFDVVVDWIAFTPEQVQLDLDLFQGKVGQYIFISSASAYQTPPSSLPVTESTPLDNPYWLYSRNKIACEELLRRAYRDNRFPMTIVRPSHTYDKTMFPFNGGYTVVGRMRQGKPVVVHGDGTSLWTMTHHTDFAKGFVGLMGNSRAIGDAFHITSSEWLNWNQIYQIFADAAGVSNPELVHIPSDLINAYDANLGAGLLGDKAVSLIFDNSKVKGLVPDFLCTTPLSRGAREVMAWHDADPARQVVDTQIDTLMDRLIEAYQKAWPQ